MVNLVDELSPMRLEEEKLKGEQNLYSRHEKFQATAASPYSFTGYPNA